VKPGGEAAGGGGASGGPGAEQPARGALSPQVRVGRPEVLLDGLEPGRNYEVSVQSLRGPEASEAQSVQARTCEYPCPRPPAHIVDAPF
jgi:hypothetical protein